MTESRADAETDLTPDEERRLLEAARRAREDVAAGRVYRSSEAGLKALLAEAARRDTPPDPGILELLLTPEGEAQEVIAWGLRAGLLERAES